MRGDFSQLFEDDTHVACVLQQQGQILRDADLNEQALRFWERLRLTAKEVSEALRAIADPPASPLTAKVGPDFELNVIELPYVMYVEGIRVDFRKAPDISLIEKRALSTKDLNLLLGESANEDLPPGEYRLLLELRETAAAVTEHDRYSDSALPGIESATRLMSRPILRLIKTGPGAVKPYVLPAERMTKATLKFWPHRDLGNRLYRFEVHKPGKTQKPELGPPSLRPDRPETYATLKWSRDNGSTIYDILIKDQKQPPIDGVAEVKEKDLTLAPNSRDQVKQLKPGMWIEMLDPSDVQLFDRHPVGTLVQIDSVDEVNGTVKLKEKVNVRLNNSQPGAEFRIASFVVWDQQQTKKDKDNKTVPVRDVFVDTYKYMVPPEGKRETGVNTNEGFSLSIKPGDDQQLFVPGDYWVVPVRSGDELRKDGDDPRPLEAELRKTVRLTELTRFSSAGNGTLGEPTGGGGASLFQPGDELLAQSEIQREPDRLQTAHVERATLPIRDIPLKLLDITVQSPHLQQWVASAELSEVAHLDEAALREKVEKSIDVPDDQRELFEADLKSFVVQIQQIVSELPEKEDALA